MAVISGKCSWFGGPEDLTGVSPEEGLAFIYTVDDKPALFLSYAPIDPELGEPCTGLARRLNPEVAYIACRWPYEMMGGKAEATKILLKEMALVTAKKNGRTIKCYPADWGPHEETSGGRVADLSPGALEYLQIETDDIVEVVFPFTSRTAIPVYERICISSGHAADVGGASGILEEVPEARRVVDRLAELLRDRGVEVETFHDNVSRNQSENLQRITDWHNDQDRELDISVHLNASQETDQPMGCEVFYVTQQVLASDLSAAIAAVGFKDRGGKFREDLWFLNQTMMPSVLVEICFVDSSADASLYVERFEEICEFLANALGGMVKTARRES